MALDIITDPLTKKQFSRDLSIPESTYQPYTPSEQGAKAPAGKEYGPTGQLQSINSINTAPTIPIQPTTPEISTPFDVSSLSAPEKEAQTETELARRLRFELAEKPTFQTEQETLQGVPEIQKTINDLQAKQRVILNEAAQIQLTAPKAGQGGLPTEIIQRQQAEKLRENAVQALSVSSLLSAAQGNMANAQYLVDKAVSERFSPIEAKQKAVMDNLDSIIKSPEYTAAEKDRATKQKAIENAKSALIKSNKDAYDENLKLANELIKNGFTDPIVLSQIQNAKDSEGNYSTAVAQQIAGKTGALQKIDTSVTEIGGRKLLVNNQTGETIKDLGAATGGGGTPTDTIQYYADQVRSGAIDLTNVPAETRDAVAQVLAQGTKPKDFTDEEIRKLVNEDKTGNATYEQVIQGIDSDTTIANKDRAKLIAGEIFGVQQQNPKLETEIARLKQGGILNDADIRSSLRKRGYSDTEISSSSLGGVGSIIESITNYLFKN